MQKLLNDIANRTREFMEFCRLTEKALAEKANMKEIRLKKILAGTLVNMTLGDVIKLCVAFGIELSDFFDDRF